MTAQFLKLHLQGMSSFHVKVCEPWNNSVVLLVRSTSVEAPQSRVGRRSTDGLVLTSSSREGKVSRAAVQTMQSPGKHTV